MIALPPKMKASADRPFRDISTTPGLTESRLLSNTIPPTFLALMRRHLVVRSLLVLCAAAFPAAAQTKSTQETRAAVAPDLSAAKPGRDPNQPIDEEYTKKIREYTTETFFNSPLVDYLPASKTVPTPKAVLGDVAGAPGKLPYSHEVYKYMRMLEKASPRVKVFSIGTTEEGREMIAVAVTSEANMSTLEENRARLAKLGDPRTINMDDAEGEKLVAASTPIYYITGTIHSPETGAPTALMELAYRLAGGGRPHGPRDPRQRHHDDHAGRRSRRPRPPGRRLPLAPGPSEGELPASHLLGSLRG